MSNRGKTPPLSVGTANRSSARTEVAAPAESVGQRDRETQSAATEDPSGIVTVDEASARYAGEWVLMRVTGKQGPDNILVGEVLYHSPSRHQITKAVKRAHELDPKVHLCVFPGGMRLLKGDDLRAALAAGAAARPYANARW